MNVLSNGQNLRIINLIIVTYFFLLWLVNYYKIESGIIRFFGELLTIPFLIAQLVFLVLGALYLKKHPKDYITLGSYLLLMSSMTAIITSFSKKTDTPFAKPT
ncbi:hypothetical protein [Leeuwenhoekiella marinoflava]|uniref:hypothetical protein n=1 Tax=Leeuwenhoekiella marinoflava TaxID=988 RepID=UPI0030011571